MSAPLAEALRNIAASIDGTSTETQLLALAKRIERVEEVVLALETTGTWVDESTFYLAGVGVPVMLSRAMNTYRAAKWKPKMGHTARVSGMLVTVLSVHTVSPARGAAPVMLFNVETTTGFRFMVPAESLKEPL